eukprot:1156572-Pelagomonas_calceolata.AAC.7
MSNVNWRKEKSLELSSGVPHARKKHTGQKATNEDSLALLPSISEPFGTSILGNTDARVLLCDRHADADAHAISVCAEADGAHPCGECCTCSASARAASVERHKPYEFVGSKELLAFQLLSGWVLLLLCVWPAAAECCTIAAYALHGCNAQFYSVYDTGATRYCEHEQHDVVIVLPSPLKAVSLPA